MVKDSFSSWSLPFASFIKRILPKEILGTVWDSLNAQKAFDEGDLRSIGGGTTVRVAFRNLTPLPLILCWVNEQGIPHHFYQVPPSTNIQDDPVSLSDHIETSCVGHAFCFALCDDVKTVKKKKTLRRVIGGYRPLCNRREGGSEIHLVNIFPGATKGCCEAQRDYSVRVRIGEVDPTPLDTSDKYYEKSILGGWPVRLEKNWHGGDKKLQKLYEDHMRIATECLPPHARKFLEQNTPFWINKSLSYGPAVCPTNARAMCFHPGVDWLKENGMCEEKCECVEIYCAKEYTEDCELWGPGGVLLHELCHAYHWKMVPGGYDNAEIRSCYEKAMKERLYDRVKVHGSQGPFARAYACENAMEYFAELSVAFLAGKDKGIEYNKWQPFNREELRDFDPRAYKLLQKIWKVDCADGTK